MKKLSILFFMFFIINYLPAQEQTKDTLSRKEMRKKRREENEVKSQKQFEETYQMLLNKSFVFKIEQAQDRHVYYLNENLNFLLVDSTYAMIQAVKQYGWVGDNGFGGQTAQGQITRYELVKHDKHKSCSLTLRFNTKLYGDFDIYFSFSSTGEGSANVTYGIWGKYSIKDTLLISKNQKF